MRGLALVVTFAAAALGAGCGFHLRGSATYAFSSIHVASPRANISPVSIPTKVSGDNFFHRPERRSVHFAP